MGPSGHGPEQLLHILGVHDSAWTVSFSLHDDPIHQLSTSRCAERRMDSCSSYRLLDNLAVLQEHLNLPCRPAT